MAGKNKPNVWYLVILGAAGAGLALDTFVIRAKASTETVVDETPEAVEAAASTSSRTLPVQTEPLGTQFDNAAAPLEPPAFRRLDGFAKPKLEVIQSAAPEKASPTGAFATRHKLTAVLSQPSGDLAVVDGLLLRIGDTVEGLRLVKIEKDAAVFEGDEKSIRLPLARPAFDR